MPLHFRGVEAMSSEENIRRSIRNIDGAIASIASRPGFPDSLSDSQLAQYNQSVEERNRLAKLIDAPFAYFLTVCTVMPFFLIWVLHLWLGDPIT